MKSIIERHKILVQFGLFQLLILGKSEFGRHYIPKSRELWKDVGEKSEFQETLCAYQTVHIVLHNGASLEDSFDSVMLKSISRPMFDSSNPEIILNLPNTVHEFLKEITKSVGPLFIVLDEIGAAFELNSVFLAIKTVANPADELIWIDFCLWNGNIYATICRHLKND